MLIFPEFSDFKQFLQCFYSAVQGEDDGSENYRILR